MNIFSGDAGLTGAGCVLDLRGEIVACFDLPTIGDGTRCRIDAANLADLIRAHGPYAFAIIEQVGARPGQGVSSMFRFGQAYGTLLGAIGAFAISGSSRFAGQVEKGARPQQRRRNLPRPGNRNVAHHADLFARKRDHNRAEACLLGTYGLSFAPKVPNQSDK